MMEFEETAFGKLAKELEERQNNGILPKEA